MTSLLKQSGITREFVKEALLGKALMVGGRKLLGGVSGAAKALPGGRLGTAANVYGTAEGAASMNDAVRMGRELGAQAASMG